MIRVGLVWFTATFFMIPSANADPGFWPLNSIDIPAAIQERGGSVYQIIVLSPEVQRVAEGMTCEELLLREERLLEEDLKKPPTETAEATPGLLYQLRSSNKSEQGPCELHEVMAIGTAFEAEVGPGSTALCTSYSRVEALIKPPVAEAPIDMLLVDKNLKVVFDTRLEGNTAVVSAAAPELDAAMIELSARIGEPLRFGQIDVFGGSGLQEIYIMGYPLVQDKETKETDCYAYPIERYHLSVTIGEIFTDPAHSQEPADSTRIECDADSAPGMLGGPAFNERGHVIGILTETMKYEVGSYLVPAGAVHERLSVDDL